MLVAVVGFVACKSSDKKTTGVTLTAEEKAKAISDSTNFTTIQWLDPVDKELGTLKKDSTIEISYRFKNTGDKNLVIENVTAQCGCTIPEKPEQAFGPGDEGVIKAKFNGSGHGVIKKEIYVIAITKPKKDHTLSFTGEVNE